MSIETIKCNYEWSFDRENPIGSGGFGAVYQASSSEMEGAFCLKVTPISEEYIREADMVKMLQHKNFQYIIPVIDSGFNAEQSEFLFVMPLGEKSLQDHLEECGVLDELEAASILLDVVKGLREADLVIHRDIKPSNIILSEGVWKIADFGVSKFAPDRTSKHTLRGPTTPAFAAPELWERGLPVTKAVDIYALGCVGMFLINGSLPFLDKSMSRLGDLHRKFLPPLDHNRNGRLNAILQRMLMKLPNERGSLEELAFALESFLHREGDLVAVEEDLNRAATRYIRNRERTQWNPSTVSDYAKTWEDDIRSEKELWLKGVFTKFYARLAEAIPFPTRINGRLFTFHGVSIEYRFETGEVKTSPEFQEGFQSLQKRTLSAAFFDLTDYDSSTTVSYTFWCRAPLPAERNYDWEVIAYTQDGGIPQSVTEIRAAAQAESSGISSREASEPFLLRSDADVEQILTHLTQVTVYAVESSLEQNRDKIRFYQNY